MTLGRKSGRWTPMTMTDRVGRNGMAVLGSSSLPSQTRNAAENCMYSRTPLSTMSVALARMKDAVSFVVRRVHFEPFVRANLALIALNYRCLINVRNAHGYPRITNLGASRTDLFYERRRLGTPTRLEPTERHERSCLTVAYLTSVKDGASLDHALR